MKKFIFGLCASLTSAHDLFLKDNNFLTIEQLLSADQEGNTKTALSLMANLTKMELVSDINDFDKKAIGYDDVIKMAKNLLEKKTPKKTQEMWDNIIAIVANQNINPTDEVEGLTYMDRRKNYARFGDVFAKIGQLRAQIVKDKTDGNSTTDWQDDQMELNRLILQSDMDLD